MPSGHDSLLVIIALKRDGISTNCVSKTSYTTCKLRDMTDRSCLKWESDSRFLISTSNVYVHTNVHPPTSIYKESKHPTV